MPLAQVRSGTRGRPPPKRWVFTCWGINGASTSQSSSEISANSSPAPSVRHSVPVLQLQKCGEEFQAATAPGRCLVPPLHREHPTAATHSCNRRSTAGVWSKLGEPPFPSEQMFQRLAPDHRQAGVGQHRQGDVPGISGPYWSSGLKRVHELEDQPGEARNRPTPRARRRRRYPLRLRGDPRPASRAEAPAGPPARSLVRLWVLLHTGERLAAPATAAGCGQTVPAPPARASVRRRSQDPAPVPGGGSFRVPWWLAVLGPAVLYASDLYPFFSGSWGLAQMLTT